MELEPELEMDLEPGRWVEEHVNHGERYLEFRCGFGAAVCEAGLGACAPHRWFCHTESGSSPDDRAVAYVSEVIRGTEAYDVLYICGESCVTLCAPLGPRALPVSGGYRGADGVHRAGTEDQQVDSHPSRSQ